MPEPISADFVVDVTLSASRLDQALAELMPEYSRARLQGWIKQGFVTVNGQARKPKEKVKVNDLISVEAELQPEARWLAEPIALSVVYEDAAILVINKPAGMVVHPAAGHYSGTLVNAVLHHYPPIDAVPRAGIVHRLDKDTSGLMVVAKTLTAHASLVDQLQTRSMGREYEALAQGVLTGGGTVDLPIARHPQNRKKMAVHEFGKPAITHYRILQRFDGYSHLRVKLETGRTHQIRVHMAHSHHPLVGDPVYGGRIRMPKGLAPELQASLLRFDRQALHAKKLTLIHPDSHQEMSWESALPDDMQALLAALEEYA